MGHFVILVIIPNQIFVQGNKEIRNYIDVILNMNKSKTSIVKTKKEISDEYKDKIANKEIKKSRYGSVRDYVLMYLHNDLDKNGNMIEKQKLYDYYVVGGRFDGLLVNNTNDSFGFEEQYQTIENNSIIVSKFTDKYDSKESIYPVIFDRDGKLHKFKDYECETWFTEDNKEKWKASFNDMLLNSKDDYIVNLDCHY